MLKGVGEVKGFWRGVKRSNPFLLLICIVLVIMMYINFNYGTDMTGLENKYHDQKNQLDTINKEVLDAIVASEISDNSSKMKLVIDYMVDKIHLSYGTSYRTLASDFENPDSQKALYSILDEGMRRLNLKDDSNSKFVITSRYSILSMLKTNTSEGKIDEDSEQLMKYVKAHYREMMDRNIQNVLIDTSSGKEVTISEVEYDFIKGNPTEKYCLLIPTYITTEGDIFGKSDFDSIGNPQKNYRMMIVRITPFDEILKSNYFLDREIKQMYNDIDDNYHDDRVSEVEKRLTYSVILLLASLSVGYMVQLSNYNRNREK